MECVTSTAGHAGVDNEGETTAEHDSDAEREK